MRRTALYAAMALHFSLAASAEKSENAEKTLDAIQVTATRRAESATDVPQAVTVVSEAELRRRTGQTNADLLHGDVGTFVQQTTPGQAVLIVRGLKGSEVLHMVDGFRLNNAFFRNAPNQYPALIDPLMIEQIEVVICLPDVSTAGVEGCGSHPTAFWQARCGLPIERRLDFERVQLFCRTPRPLKPTRSNRSAH